MNKEIENLLVILGFPRGELRVPKMKEVRKQFLKLAMIKHPDKATGNDKDMKMLLDAYHRVGKFIEDMVTDDVNDEEELTARDHFKQFNFSNVNKNSITMMIFSMHAGSWEQILTEVYGPPIDNSATKNGKKWTLKVYKTENKVGSVFIQIWNKYPQEKSTMLIQAEKCYLSLSINFFQNEIPFYLQLFVIQYESNSYKSLR